MPRPAAGTAVCYLRDSEGESEQSPVQYLPWVAREVAKLGLAFRGDEPTALAMARSGDYERGDLYLDYGVSGNLLSRPGFDALRRRVLADRAVSHVYVPRRDRLARPDDPLEALVIEFEMRRAGATIVLLDKVLAPFAPGARVDLAELLTGLIEYDASGRFRRELAQKLVLAKVKLAGAGFSIGGDPPYGFRRWLTSADGVPKRELERGEQVKLAGHHVVWLPTAEAELAVVRRILDAIETTPAARIARQLTAEGIPAPGAGRGSSGLWTQNTVKRIATHPLLAAVLEYGRRSEGDQQRLTPGGSRDLTASDFGPDGKPRRIANADVIRVEATFDPIVDPERRGRILAVVEGRGRHLKGKPRTRGGAANPLGGRIFDMACGWPMYRNAKRGRFGYSCGLYMNSDAKRCSHNMVAGEAATRFVLSAVRQRVLSPDLQAKLEARLRTLAAAEAGRDPGEEQRRGLERSLADARRRRDTTGGNLALAATQEQFAFVAASFDKASAEVKGLEARLRDLPPPRGAFDAEREVRSALAGLDRVADLAADAGAEGGVADLVSAVDAKLYLNFRAEGGGGGRRYVPSGGVLTFGSSSPPVALYPGPTDKAIVRAMIAAGEPVQVTPGGVPRGEVESQAEVGRSGNVPRVTRRCT